MIPLPPMALGPIFRPLCGHPVVTPHMLIEQLPRARDGAEAGALSWSSEWNGGTERGPPMARRQEDFRQWKMTPKRIRQDEVSVAGGAV